MNILTINTRYIGGGGAAYIANILHKQINKTEGYSSTFLYGRGIDGDKDTTRIIYPNMDYLSALSFRISGKEFNINKDIEKQIEDCDIVHLHNIHGYYIDYIKLFKILKKYNKKIVWTLHDMWPITGRCGYSFGCEKWKLGCGNCRNKQLYPSSIVDRSKTELDIKKSIIGDINKDNIIIVTPSKWLANMCRESYLKKFEIIDIPNGIDHQVVKLSKISIRDKYNIPKDKKVLLFVAADTRDKRKGINYILDMIPICREFIFVSIGKEITNVSFDNFIQLGYMTDREKINEIYSMSDLFIIPSLDDNFPTTVLESFANSTPVIGFKQGGIPEQISDINGSIVEDINVTGLVKAVRKILSNDSDLMEKSNNSRLIFEKKYKLDTFVEKYIKLYNR